MFFLVCLIGVFILFFPLFFFFVRFCFNFSFYTALHFPFISFSFFLYCFFIIFVNLILCYKIIKLLFLFNILQINNNSNLSFFLSIFNNVIRYPVNLLNAFFLNSSFFRNFYFNFYLFWFKFYYTVVLNNSFFLFFFNKIFCLFICFLFSFFPVILFICFLFYEIFYLYCLHYVYYIMLLFFFSRLFSFFFKQFLEFLYIFLDFMKTFISYNQENDLISINFSHLNCKVFLDCYGPNFLSMNAISYDKINNNVANNFVDFFCSEMLFLLVNTEIFIQFMESIYKIYERFLCLSYLFRFCFVIFMVFVVLSINFDYF